MITNVVDALGQWNLNLSEDTPDEILSQLGYFGHIAIVRGLVDVEGTGDGLLRAARYVGVLREKHRPDVVQLFGVGMATWLGDEDHKGHIFETPITLTNATFRQAVLAVLPSAVTAGTIYDQPGTYSGVHQWETPRDALDTICTAFNCEWRVNGDATLDAGKVSQLYQTNPTSIVVRKGAGKDMDLSSLGAAVEVDIDVVDYSTRIVLLGQDQNNGQFAESSISAPSVPYLDLHGNPVERTRMISDSSTTPGAVDAAAALNLNRFNRTRQALSITAQGYELEGDFQIGDYTYVFDPETGIVNPANEVYFHGDVLHPDVIRITAISWPVTRDYTVAFRKQDGTWLDLTRYVVWESGGNQITVGDLPNSLTNPGSNVVQARVLAAQGDTIPPNAPTGLTLGSIAVNDINGNATAVLNVSWTAPTTNTDSSVFDDLSYYLVAYQPNLGVAPWLYTQTTDVSVAIPAYIGAQYTVKVAAVDTSGNQSAWSSTAQITTASDATAPNPPSQPTVTNYLGQLRIAWDGKDNGGGTMPPDFNRVNVYVDTTQNFTPSGSNLVASMVTSGAVYATAPYGATRWVKLLAFDNSGNASAASTAVSGATAAVATGDIQNLAVNDAQIGNVNVGKLTAGTMSADVVTSGRFTTALTGARREMNAIGFQAWDASNNLIINLDGVNNLLTGVFQTARSGRAITIGASGNTGQIIFNSPLNGYFGMIREWTQSNGVEAMQFGLPVQGSNSLWNVLNVNSSPLGQYTLLRSGTLEFVYDSSGNQADSNGNVGVGRFVIYEDTAASTGRSGDGPAYARMQIDSNGCWINGGVGSTASVNFYSSGEVNFSQGTNASWNWKPTGQVSANLNGQEFDIYGGSVSGGGWLALKPSPFGNAASLVMRLLNGSGNGTSIKAWGDSNGIWTENKSWDDQYWYGIRAANFQVNSDARHKYAVREFSHSALEHIRSAKVKHYRRHTSASAVEEPEEIGLIAQEAPELIRQAMREDGSEMGIGLYQMASLLWAAMHEVDDRLNALEGDK